MPSSRAEDADRGVPGPPRSLVPSPPSLPGPATLERLLLWRRPARGRVRTRRSRGVSWGMVKAAAPCGWGRRGEGEGARVHDGVRGGRRREEKGDRAEKGAESGPVRICGMCGAGRNSDEHGLKPWDHLGLLGRQAPSVQDKHALTNKPDAQKALPRGRRRPGGRVCHQSRPRSSAGPCPPLVRERGSSQTRSRRHGASLRHPLRIRGSQLQDEALMVPRRHARLLLRPQSPQQRRCRW